jgi:NTE family protein
MLKKSSPYCLVLAGGGAKGVYHIGAWKALEELGIDVVAFIGNSIGAIIAGFLAQGETKRLEELSHQIGLNFILNMPDEFIKDGEFKLTSANQLAAYKKFYKTTVAKKGLDTGPLRKMLTSNLDEDAIRTSGKDLGVVTYNLSDMKPKEIYIEDMGSGHLIDYLLASAALPGFELPEINGKKYIDGGVYDNIPYTMAQQRGYKRIIIVDISGLGVKRKLDIEGMQIVYIKNSVNMGGVLDFNKKFLNDFTRLGYLDTMRTFDRLKGHHYFLVPQEKLEKQFSHFLTQPENSEKLKKYVEEFFEKQERSTSLHLNKIFPEHSRFVKNWLSVFVDCAATILSIERIKQWDYQHAFEEMSTRHRAVLDKLEKLEKKGVKQIESVIRDRIKEKKLAEEPYYYFLLVDRFIPSKAQKLLKKGLFSIYPELVAGHFFISQLREFWFNRK